VGGVSSPEVNGGGDVVTWHHGLMARWWANFNLDGPEIDYFRPFVEAGQPALDAACGTGRLLVPWVAAGLDVDGVDASADMIARCREAAERVGRSPALHVQPLHRLDLPRRYGSIVVCGGFGLGATRAQDVEGLHRLFAHLEPGGLVALDYEVEEFDAESWRRWQPAAPDPAPPAPADRRLGPDGFEYALRHRVVAVDHDTKQMTREMQAWQWSDGELVAHETHALVANVYTSSEIVDALGDAGFDDVTIVGGYHGGEPTGDEEFLVYLARRPPRAP
jgi:SAM-dependent methyltransferase